MRTILSSTALFLALASPALAARDAVEPRAPEPPSAAEHQLAIEGMRPPKRARPLVAVVALNEGTETTDFLVPYGVLSRSGAADVVAVAPDDAPVHLEPAPLRIRVQQTLAAFTAAHPDGADYVVVPKILPPGDDADVVAFIQAQRATGATIVSVCAGAVTVSAAGLLEGRTATTHWYSLEDVMAENPTMTWVPDRRYLVDDGVVSTTGVTASLPVSLALVEAIAGPERARALADELGVATWDARHDSSAFALDGALFVRALKNKYLAREHVWGVPVEAGVDEIGLAFTADAWSRSRRSVALAVAEDLDEIPTAHGLVLIPDLVVGDARIDGMLPAPTPEGAARALPTALEAIAATYDEKTARFVAIQLEYAWTP